MGELSYGIMFGDKRERHGGHDLNIEATNCVNKTYTWVSYGDPIYIFYSLFSFVLQRGLL